MSRLLLHVSVGLLGVVCVPGTSAAGAERPAQVRVVNAPARVLRWFHAPATETVAEVQPGTTLEVLDEDTGWYWVILPPDAHGTRRPGWIRVSDVEPVVRDAAAMTPQAGQGSEPAPPVGADPAPGARPATAVAADDHVSVTETRDDAPARSSSAPAVTKPYAFADVHFDRDRYDLLQEDMGALRAVVTALKTDPSLVVNIEGYTCSIGSRVYNLALGARRATAVKNYLVGEGVAADRLHAVSLGEGHAQYDNSREETRRLNRRVALVPTTETAAAR
jgi:outer membrane protein OmpA-like peptidoglycan-associated protein